MKFSTIFISIIISTSLVEALHFYLETGQTKCFFEDLPQDTLVVGRYEAVEVNKNHEAESSDKLAVEITVDETFDNDHRVVQQKGPARGEFTYTSLDTGEHRFCITPTHINSKNWLGSNKQNTRIFLDLAFGALADFIDLKKTNTLNSIYNKVNQLDSMLEEIQRHQQTIRDKEAEFKDSSDLVRFSVLKWTVLQVLILVTLGYLQLRYLRYFFKKQKVV